MTRGRRWSRADWLIIGGLAALAILAWSRVLFSMHWSFGVELDFLRQFYPARAFEVKALASGTFPLWSPSMLSGYPFYASYQTAMLYPFNLLMVGLYAAAGADFSLKAQCGFVVFHFFLAGLFTYILGRELKLGRTGSAIAAIAFMFSGYMVAHAGHINQVSAAAWMPLAFFLFYRSLDRRKLSYAVATGVTLGIALLAGHLQPIFYLCLMLLLFVFYTAIVRWRGDDSKPGILFGLGALAIAVVVGGALASAQLVPTFELTRLSVRREIPFGIASSYSLPRRQLVMLLFPHFYGSTAATYTGGWVMWEVYGYGGIVAGALAVVALLRKRKAFVVFLWVILILSVILALGPGGFLFTALFKTHLLFNRFRDPARVLVIFGFVSALLAGFGADHVVSLVSDPSQRQRYRSAVRVVAVLLAITVLIIIAVALFPHIFGARAGGAGVALRSAIVPTVFLAGLLALFLVGPRIPRAKVIFGGALVALVLADLIVLNVPWAMVRINPDDPYGDAAASRYIARKAGDFRVETDANTMYPSLDNGELYGLQKASGDDSLVLYDYNLYRNLISPSVAPGVQLDLFKGKGVRSPLLDMMNDRYFMSRRRIPPQLAAGKFVYLGRKGTVHIYRNLSVLPGARMSDALVVADSEAAFRTLERTGGALGGVALVTRSEVGGTAGTVIPASKGGVALIKRSPNYVAFKTDPSCKGLLATAEVSYPGWEVFIDGKPAHIITTNFLFRGVMLAGGQRKVEFRFKSKSVCAGIVVSLATLALLAMYLGGLIWIRRRQRIGETNPPDKGLT